VAVFLSAHRVNIHYFTRFHCLYARKHFTDKCCDKCIYMYISENFWYLIGSGPNMDSSHTTNRKFIFDVFLHFFSWIEVSE